MLRYHFFQAWGSLTCLKSQTRVPKEGLVLRNFYVPKNLSSSVGFEPANLALGASTLPRDHRGRRFYNETQFLNTSNHVFTLTCPVKHHSITQCISLLMDALCVLILHYIRFKCKIFTYLNFQQNVILNWLEIEM